MLCVLTSSNWQLTEVHNYINAGKEKTTKKVGEKYYKTGGLMTVKTKNKTKSGGGAGERTPETPQSPIPR